MSITSWLLGKDATGNVYGVRDGDIYVTSPGALDGGRWYCTAAAWPVGQKLIPGFVWIYPKADC